MTTELTQNGFMRLVAAHLATMPMLKQVTNRTDEALLCQTKTGQTFLVLVTGPGEERGERKTEAGRPEPELSVETENKRDNRRE